MKLFEALRNRKLDRISPLEGSAYRELKAFLEDEKLKGGAEWTDWPCEARDRAAGYLERLHANASSEHRDFSFRILSAKESQKEFQAWNREDYFYPVRETRMFTIESDRELYRSAINKPLTKSMFVKLFLDTPYLTTPNLGNGEGSEVSFPELSEEEEEKVLRDSWIKLVIVTVTSDRPEVIFSKYRPTVKISQRAYERDYLPLAVHTLRLDKGLLDALYYDSGRLRLKIGPQELIARVLEDYYCKSRHFKKFSKNHFSAISEGIEPEVNDAELNLLKYLSEGVSSVKVGPPERFEKFLKVKAREDKGKELSEADGRKEKTSWRSYSFPYSQRDEMEALELDRLHTEPGRVRHFRFTNTSFIEVFKLLGLPKPAVEKESENYLWLFWRE